MGRKSVIVTGGANGIGEAAVLPGADGPCRVRGRHQERGRAIEVARVLAGASCDRGRARAQRAEGLGPGAEQPRLGHELVAAELQGGLPAVAARDVFAENGTDASLEDIARRANVGIGTLYRNFPTRQDLLEAVYAGEVEELCLGAQAVAELEPWDAFTTWLDSFARYVPTKLALLQALNKDSEVFRACKSAMLTSALPIFERAQQSGAVRKDVSLDDVTRMISGMVASTYADDDQRQRVIGIALDGLRAR